MRKPTSELLADLAAGLFIAAMIWCGVAAFALRLDEAAEKATSQNHQASMMRE